MRAFTFCVTLVLASPSAGVVKVMDRAAHKLAPATWSKLHPRPFDEAANVH